MTHYGLAMMIGVMAATVCLLVAFLIWADGR